MQPLDQNAVDLLRAITRPPSDALSAAVAQIANKVDGWDDVIEAARRHGILPMFYRRLSELPDAIPSHALQQAKNEFERNAFHCMTNAEELLHVLSAFENAGIASMPYKGVVLAASAYRDMTMRTAGDIDLLIRCVDLQRATDILKQRGYLLKTLTLEDGSPEAEDYFEYHFERPCDGIVLELRWKLELTQPRFRHQLGLDWAWPRRTAMKLAGADVPNLDPVSSLLVLCMHGSKHAWSRWMWICDVAMLIQSEPGLDWDFARREAKRIGLERCLALGVLLAWRAGADVPQHILRVFEADRDMSRLAEFFATNVLHNPGAIPGGRVPYFLRILGFRDRVRCLLSPSILQPNERDRAAVKLPKALQPLYYVIRPFRVLLDRSGR
jgi:hypothetical protein